MKDAENPFVPPEQLIQRFGLTIVDEKEAAEIEERERKQDEEAERIRRLSWYRSASSGVPERYYNESLDTFKVTNESTGLALQKTRELIASNKCRTLILCGGHGLGKSHLGCGAIREFGGTYTTMLRLVYEVDSTMSFKAQETKIQLLDRMCETRLLVMDEVARMKVREEFQQELVAYILIERYARLKKTIIIGNLKKDELLKWLGNAVVDRLRECAECVELSGQTYRNTKRAEVFGIQNKNNY